MIKSIIAFVVFSLKLIAYLGLCLAAFFALIVFTQSFDSKKTNRAPGHSVSNELKIVMAQDEIRKILRDPSSAKFSSSYVAKRGAICGIVSAKNGFGGMNKDHFVYYLGVANVFHKIEQSGLCDR